MVLLVLFNQYVIPSSVYISSLILSKQRLATLPASTLQDTYTCHNQLLCEVLIVCLDRHKMTTLTPSLHMESYSPDDNRFDLRFVHPLYISRHCQFPYVHLGKLGRVRIADDTLSLGPFSTRTSHGRIRKLRGVLRH